MSEKIYRLHYRGQLREGISAGELDGAVKLCVSNIRQAQKQGKVLTAALYYSERMLFFYYEAVGEALTVAEPLTLSSSQIGETVTGVAPCQGGETVAGVAPYQSTDILPETGEDMQLTCLHPDELLVPLAPYLQVWPGQADDRLWVHMYHIYYHNVPESVSEWKRAGKPELRRGRIAFLREDKVFSYVFYHKALVDEGLLLGDKYQSIALHENILFSYFEEPKTMTNVQKDFTRQSEVINEWLAENPEAHFIHMPEGEGANFMFLPALFAVGLEDEGELW